MTGHAIQCRITTEDPANDFMPDTGTIESYRSPGGFGIRLDGGNGFQGSTITPFYDSLLLKVTAYSRSFEDTRRKAIRALRETEIKGVKTNIAFMLNVLNHPTFAAGDCDTGFIANTPDLLDIAKVEDNELRVIEFLGNKFVNETKGAKKATMFRYFRNSRQANSKIYRAEAPSSSSTKWAPRILRSGYASSRDCS